MLQKFFVIQSSQVCVLSISRRCINWHSVKVSRKPFIEYLLYSFKSQYPPTPAGAAPVKSRRVGFCLSSRQEEVTGFKSWLHRHPPHRPHHPHRFQRFAYTAPFTPPNPLRPHRPQRFAHPPTLRRRHPPSLPPPLLCHCPHLAALASVLEVFKGFQCVPKPPPAPTAPTRPHRPHRPHSPQRFVHPHALSLVRSLPLSSLVGVF